MQLETCIAGLRLQHPLVNAAGTCKLLDGVHGVLEIARSAAAAVMVGSITAEERAGNSGNVYRYQQDRYRQFSLNSLGLPNPGATYYEKYLPEMARVVHEADKFLFVSVAGFSPSEYSALAKIAELGGADLIELNLGCPNVWAGGKQKQIACFNAGLVRQILRTVAMGLGASVRLAVKVSPFSDPSTLAEVADAIADSKRVTIVTTTNTFPNGFSFNNEPSQRAAKRPAIDPANGLAGFAGPAIFGISLGQVRQLADLLPNHIDIIGVGGISQAQDVCDYLHTGARAVQVATAFMEEGPRVFERLLAELMELPD